MFLLLWAKLASVHHERRIEREKAAAAKITSRSAVNTISVLPFLEKANGSDPKTWRAEVNKAYEAVNGNRTVFHKSGRPHQARGELSQCTNTVFHGPPAFHMGPTKTVYTTTATATVSVDCGECSALSVKMIPGALGPVTHFTTTVTAEEPYITSVFVCGSGDDNDDNHSDDNDDDKDDGNDNGNIEKRASRTNDSTSITSTTSTSAGPTVDTPPLENLDPSLTRRLSSIDYTNSMLFNQKLNWFLDRLYKFVRDDFENEDVWFEALDRALRPGSEDPPKTLGKGPKYKKGERVEWQNNHYKN